MMTLQSSPMSVLTEDLVEDILSRVPATSLVRLRSTCKQWNGILNDRRFIKKHFDTAEKEYLDMLLRSLRVSSMSVNLHGLHDNIDPSIELKRELNLKGLLCNSGKVESFEVFHCNGLLLFTNTSTIVVWNPCTGQTKWIQTESANTRYHKYALGYENKNLCRDYKILRFLDDGTNFELEIYEFNSSSWRVLDSVEIDFELDIGSQGMSVKGNTYWIVIDDHEVDGELVNCFLTSFDFTRERFGPHVCLPFQTSWYSDVISLSSVREERLSVLFHEEDSLTMEIWLTNDITDTNVTSWSKFLRVDLYTHRFYNGVTFFIDEENKAAVFSEDVPDDSDDIHSIVYIIGQDRLRIVDLEDGPFWPQMFCYVPSLVQI